VFWNKHPSEQFIGYLFEIINLLLITGVVFFCVKAFYGAAAATFDRIYIPGERNINKTEFKIEQPHPLSYYDTIVKRNLFKTNPEGAENLTERLDIDLLERTSLELKLWGTGIQEPGGSFAVIEDSKEKKQNLYRPGDTIQNATLTKILREKVVLRIGAKDEILEMEKAAEAPGSTTASGPSNIARSSNLIIERSTVDEAAKDINSLMKQVLIRPHPDGLSVSGIKKDSIFSNMGLKNGDIIVGVDGRDIQSVDDALALYENLKSGSGASLKIKRRGRFETIEYTIK